MYLEGKEERKTVEHEREEGLVSRNEPSSTRLMYSSFLREKETKE